jgi:hypothetical protein
MTDLFFQSLSCRKKLWKKIAPHPAETTAIEQHDAYAIAKAE